MQYPRQQSHNAHIASCGMVRYGMADDMESLNEAAWCAAVLHSVRTAPCRLLFVTNERVFH